MKILIALCAILAVSTASVIITAQDPNDHILGRNKCTWGPSYWCENIKSAAKCKTIKRCINTSWKDMTVPEDNDSVCKICKDMVQQARDQLESNQTQQDLKDVFDGSCRLIHIKPIVKECVSIVDEFVPELIETLASQMNPSAVCTVAGLCNSAHIDKLLEQHGQSTTKIDEINSRSLEKDELEPDECSKCYTVASHVEFKLNNTPQDKLLQQMLKSCAYLGTFSDACSALVLTNFDGIRAHLKENFNAQNICHLSGQCSNKFHVHGDVGAGLGVEVKLLSSVGVVDINDDLPCKLCEQLVGHLRDLLVANTTEAEFEQVLKGFCKQMKSFASECTSIVDEYYPQIYEYLTKGLNSNVVCEMAALCPAPGKQLQGEEIWPLVPKDAAQIGMHIFQEAKKGVENESHMELSKSEVEEMQLPIERLMPFPLSEGRLGARGKESCALCENVLHYIQETITNPVTEDKVKRAIEKVCKRLPESIQGECSEFVDTYGDAIVAILAQEIDPSQVCPMLRLCPSKRLMQFWESIPAKYMLAREEEKPTCPLCLLAVTQIYNVIKNNKTQANIQAELDKLCNRLPNHLKDQCVDFVKGYSKELIELLLADLSPQEICTYLKLCDDTKNPGPNSIHNTNEDRQILTNEIPDSSESSLESRKGFNPSKSICELVVRKVDERVGTDRNRQRVENEVHRVCNHLPRVSRECNTLINKHGDRMIDLILEKVVPAGVCAALKLRSLDQDLEPTVGADDSSESSLESRISFNPTKSICELVVRKVDERVGTDRNRQKVENEVHRVCNHLPRVSRECNTLINKHGDRMIDLILEKVVPAGVCAALKLRSLDQDLEPTVGADDSSESSLESRISFNPTKSICELVVRKVDERVGTDRNRQKVENEVHRVCNHLPRVSRECNTLINKHGDRMIDLILEKVVPAGVCAALKLRSLDQDLEPTVEADDSSESSLESRISFNPTKSICELVVRKVDERVGTDRNRQRVENEVHRVCNHLPRVSRECNTLINKHGDRMIDLILEKVVPAGVCAALKLRSLDQDLEPTVGADDSSESSLESRISFNPTKSICELVVRKVDERVGTDRNRQKVENEVHRVCNHLPRVSRECNTLINKHGDRMIDLILEKVVPAGVCAALKLRSLDQDLEPTVGADDSSESSLESRISFNPTKSICELVVRKVDERVGTDRNRQKVENEVHRVCNHLPRVSRECNTLINKHGDRMIDLILEKVVPAGVCAALKLRSLDQDLEPTVEADDSSESSLESRISFNPTKSICELVVRKVDERVGTDRNRQRVENEVHRVCNHLPRVSRECNTLINKHGDRMIDLILEKVVPAGVCAALKLRSLDQDLEPTVGADDSSESSLESRISFNPTKSICELVVRKVDERVGTDRNRQKVENEVHRVCNHLPRVSRECNTLINKHGDRMIDLILEKVVPAGVCAALKLRSLDQDLEPTVGADDSSESSLESRISFNPTKSICELVVRKVDERVGTDRNRQKVENEVHRVCNHLPRVSRECNTLINKHGDRMIDLILEKVVPAGVCAALKLRSLDQDLEPTVEADDSSESSLESRISFNPTKSICELVVRKVDERVGTDRNRQRVENEVHRVCNHLPRVSRECNTLINKHGDRMIDLILEKVVPAGVCAALKLRSLDQDLEPTVGADDSSESSLESRISFNPTKSICELVVRKVDERVGTDRNRQKVENEVHRVCNHLPRVSRECNTLINKHGDRMIDLILEKVVPAGVCAALKLRSLDQDLEPTVGADDSSESSLESRISFNPTKSICELVVRKVDERVGTDRNRQKVENEVHRVCNHLPRVSRECNTLINKHGDRMIDLILEKVVPAGVCAALKLRSLDQDLEPTVEADDSSESSLESRISFNPTKSICELVVRKVDERVGTDRNRQRVENEVHRVCNHLPRVSRECNTLINKHGDRMIDLILEKVVPAGVCAALKLRSLDQDLEPTVEADDSSESSLESRISVNPLKSLCKLVVRKVDERVGTDRNRQRVENEVHHVCNHLPKISGECNKLINKHGDRMIDLILEKVVPAGVCAALKLRSLDQDLEPTVEADDSSESSLESRISFNPTKSICELVVRKVDERVGTDRNRQRVENEVHRVCNHLPRVSRECNTLINKHGDRMIDLILEKVVPAGVCAALKLRSLDQDLEPTVEADDSSESSLESRISVNPLKSLCKLVVRKVDERVGTDRNRQRVENEMHHVCNHLPKISGECNKLINKHGDRMIDLILEKVVPAGVCAALKLRSLDQDLEPTVEADDSSESSLESRISFNPTKSICELVVRKVDERVGTDRNRQRVENEVHRVCNHLPRVSRECNTLINKHGDRMIDLILEKVVPAGVCAALKLRSLDQDLEPTVEADDSSESSLESRISFNPTKSICELVVRKVDERVGTDRNRQRVENEVHRVCNHLPRVSRECNTLINKHGDRMIDLILEKVVPAGVCAALKLRSLDQDFEPTVEADDSSESSLESRISVNPLKSLCKLVVRKVDERVGTDRNRQRVENEVHHVCNHLPKISGECNKLINKHGDRMIDLILEKVVPAGVCAALKLRSLDQDLEPTVEADDSSESSLESRISFNPTKSICELVVRKVDERVGTDRNRQRVENEVHRVCNHLPRVSRECNTLINKHGDRMIDLILEKVVPAGVCAALKLRSLDQVLEPTVEADDSSESSLESRISVNPLKSVCKLVVRKVDERVGTDRNRQRVENEVHHVCNHLPKISGECNKLINKHGNKIIDLMLKKVVPTAVCAALSLRNFDDDLLVGEGRASEAECSMCEYALHYVGVIVPDPVTEEKTKDAVGKVCTKLPESMEGECSTFVNKYGDAIVNKLAAAVPPNLVCPILRVCPSGKFIQTPESVPTSYVPEKRNGGKPSCPLCLMAMRKLYNIIENNKTEQNIEAELNKLCSVLPQKWNGECRDLVKTYSKELIELILADLTPAEVCAYVKLCDATQDSISSNVSNTNEDGKLLTIETPDSMQSSEELKMSFNSKSICKLVVRKVDELVGTDKNRQRVENEVHHVCNHLPRISRECNEFINEYGDMMIDLMLEEVVPDVVCAALGVRSFNEDLVPIPLRASQTQCTVCKAFIGVVDELLGNSAVDRNIKNAMSKACKRLPSKYQSQCVSIVKSYGQSVINLLERHTDSKKICGAISLCAARDLSVVSLENSRTKRSYEKDPTKRCTWGSAYWCSSNATAVECKAVEHCRENVWKADFAPPKQNV